MRKLILIAHISLDGFVAGAKGELDGFDSGEENLQFVCGLTENADAALFGRVSYELLNKHWPSVKDLPNASRGTIGYSNWYNTAQKIVISKTLNSESLNNTIIIKDDIISNIEHIKREAGGNILIFGSPAIAQLLMRHNLIDSYWIFVNPVIFGSGIPLFTALPEKVKLTLIAEKKFSNGEIALHYLANK